MKTLIEIDGMKLRQARLNKGMTLSEFGGKIGLHKVTTNKWELGTRPVPAKHHKKICDLLDVTIDEIRKPMRHAITVNESLDLMDTIDAKQLALEHGTDPETAKRIDGLMKAIAEAKAELKSKSGKEQENQLQFIVEHQSQLIDLLAKRSPTCNLTNQAACPFPPDSDPDGYLAMIVRRARGLPPPELLRVLERVEEIRSAPHSEGEGGTVAS